MSGRRLIEDSVRMRCFGVPKMQSSASGMGIESWWCIYQIRGLSSTKKSKPCNSVQLAGMLCKVLHCHLGPRGSSELLYAVVRSYNRLQFS